jgi:tetratricopeptide (TPR) repeat protein
MEFLKKLIILFVFAMMLQYVNGQGTAQIAAFDSSYKLEKAAKYVDAINAIKSVYDEKSYEMNLRLGWLNYLIGQQTSSMSYYTKAIALNPFSIEARFGYIVPASVLGNWEMVKDQYAQILKIDPQNTKANYYLGLIYYNSKEYAKADKHFEICANLYPFDYDSMLMYAWNNYFMGKMREAKVLFSKLLLIRPNDKSATEGYNLIK